MDDDELEITSSQTLDSKIKADKIAANAAIINAGQTNIARTNIYPAPKSYTIANSKYRKLTEDIQTMHKRKPRSYRLQYETFRVTLT